MQFPQPRIREDVCLLPSEKKGIKRAKKEGTKKKRKGKIVRE
jgi:hypothetical protein